MYAIKGILLIITVPVLRLLTAAQRTPQKVVFVVLYDSARNKSAFVQRVQCSVDTYRHRHRQWYACTDGPVFWQLSISVGKISTPLEVAQGRHLEQTAK